VGDGLEEDRDQALLAQTSPWPNLLDYYSQPPNAGGPSRQQSKSQSPKSSPAGSRNTVDVGKLKGRLQL